MQDPDNGNHSLSNQECLAYPERHITERQRLWLDRRLPFTPLVGRLMHAIARISMRCCFRLRVIGVDRLPQDSQFIFTPNHTSHLDPLAIAAALPYRIMRRTRWAAWERTASRNFLAVIVSRYAGVVPIERNISALAAASAVLNRGENLIWFPEGHRTEDGDVQPFRRGIGFLLQHFNLPAVPVAIRGAYTSFPPGRRFQWFHSITVVIGSPVDRDQLPGSSPEEIADALRSKVVELAHSRSI